MFEYNDIKNALKNYYYKQNKDTGNRELYDRTKSEFVNDPTTKERIGAMLTIYYAIENFTSLHTKYKGEEIYLAQNFQESFVNLLKNKNGFNVNSFLNNSDNILDQYLISLAGKEQNYEKTPDYQKRKNECFNLMKILGSNIGINIKNMDLDIHASGDTAVSINWEKNELSFKEKLNPKNPLYTQPQVIEMSDQPKENKRLFVEQLIALYYKAETEKMYNDRINGEETNMKYVTNVVNNSHEISVVNKDFPKLMRLLTAAKNLSLDGKKDYLSEIINQPNIHAALLEIKQSNTLRDTLKSHAEQNEKNGMITDGRRFPKTNGELGHDFANDAIKRNPNTDIIEYYTEQIKNGAKYTVKNENINAGKIQFLKLLSIMSGKNMLAKYDNNNIILDSNEDTLTK